MHSDLLVGVQKVAADSLKAQQLACDQWRLEFNHVRPHEALDYKTPAEVYKPSPRKLAHVFGYHGYPEGWDVRTVLKHGALQYFGKIVYTTRALAGQRVAFEPAGDRVRVWFCDLLLGSYDPAAATKNVTVEPPPTKDLPPHLGVTREDARVTR